MLRSTSYGLCSISRNIPRQQALIGRAACRRGFSVGPQKNSTISVTTAPVRRSMAALLAAGLLGGFVVYQLATEPVVKAEGLHAPLAAPEDLKSKLSAQHVQVRRPPLRVLRIGLIWDSTAGEEKLGEPGGLCVG